VNSNSVKAFIVYIEEYDRSDELIVSLNKIGIPHEKVLSMSRFKDESILRTMHRGEPLYKHTIGRNLTIPEVGAYFGHQLAIKSFLNSQYDYGIIFDDDARMMFNPVGVFEHISFSSPICISLCENIDGIPKFFGLTKNLMHVHHPGTMTAHAYILNKSAAKLFVRHFRENGITSVLDWPYPLPNCNFALTRKGYFFQKESVDSYTIAKERDEVAVLTTSHALSMPIGFLVLFRRFRNLLSFDFSLRDLLRHEVVLRFRIRRFYAFFKIYRFLAFYILKYTGFSK
jgi:GR25 family glycosyltransferase involved in LPS biosynthesis